MSRIITSLTRTCLQLSRSHVINPAVRKPLVQNSRAVQTVLTRSYSGTPQPEVSPSDFDKRCLVKAKMYAKEEDVPPTVTYSQLKRARDYMRIRIATWMIVMTMFGSGVMIWWGRKERDEGKSANKMGQAQFDQWRQQGLKEQQQQQNQGSGSH